jgi:hypothetical protein
LWVVNQAIDMKYNSTLLAESSALIPVEVAQLRSLEQLTPDEQRDRYQLELQVEQAFYRAGKALSQLRQRRLYRSTHRTFEAYCQDRFGFTRRYSDYLIAGVVVVDNLQQMRTIPSQTQELNHPNQEEMKENLSTTQAPILPTKLEQIKPLASLKPVDQRQIWDKAVAAANGKVPSGRIVREMVEQLKAKPLVLVQDDCQVGDVFSLVRLKGKKKKYNGCFCIAVEPRDLTIIVDVYDATLTVKPENLNKIDSLLARQQLLQILRRTRRLREVGVLDRGADNVLEDLGKHTSLTPVEEGLLSWLEKYYGVDERSSES